MALSGYSGCGKTTLIKKLLQNMSTVHRVFYCKHDAHYFELDHRGKDSFEARASGAQGISIYSQDQWATIQNGSLPLLDQKYLALDYDFAIVEGHKHTEIKKILFLDSNNELINEYKNNTIKNVIAFITPTHTAKTREGLPCFHRDNIEAIQSFILQTFKDEARSFPLNALVLSGGKSSRMGHDKGKINYHGEPQAQHLAKLLATTCENVFFSCRADQSHEPHLQIFHQIHDSFLDLGPIGGILSYFQKYPRTRLLVVACDMPFVDSNSIQQLINEADYFRVATVFENPEKNWPEPLFSIYHPKAQTRFFQLLGAGYICPMKMLFNSHIKKVVPQNQLAVLNGNTPEEMSELKTRIKESIYE